MSCAASWALLPHCVRHPYIHAVTDGAAPPTTTTTTTPIRHGTARHDTQTRRSCPGISSCGGSPSRSRYAHVRIKVDGGGLSLTSTPPPPRLYSRRIPPSNPLHFHTQPTQTQTQRITKAINQNVERVSSARALKAGDTFSVKDIKVRAYLPACLKSVRCRCVACLPACLPV